MKNVLITTQHRGVFFAQVSEDKDLTQKMLTDLKNARMAIYWNTKRGLMELCEDGPNSGSRIGNTKGANYQRAKGLRCQVIADRCHVRLERDA